MKLWLVGKIYISGEGWEFVGIYDAEELAVSHCTSWFHFVAPIELNATAPDERADFPGAYYPLGESPDLRP